MAHAIADDLLQQQLLVKLMGALDHGGKVVMKLILIILTLAAAAAGAVGGGGGGGGGDDHRQQPVLRLELFRRDHPLSPLVDSTTSRPNLTMSEKFLEAVKRSNRRRDAIVRSIHEAAAGRRAAAAANDDAGAGVSSSSAYYNIPVAAGDGEYLTQIALGTPTQVVTAIVDTGSDLMWTQCLPCTSCYAQSSPVFNPATSSTYQVVNCGNNLCRDLEVVSCDGGCEYEYGYGDGSSTSGVFATDMVTLGTGSVPNIGFGCGHTNLGSFSGAGGLVGLGQGPLSLISQLNSATVSKKFSYCLVSLSSPNTSALIFGDTAVSSATGVAYTPIVHNPINPTYYYIGLAGISVAGRSVLYPTRSFAIDDATGNGGLILDSGTTLTYLEVGAYIAVLVALRAALTYPIVSGAPYGLDLCFSTRGMAELTLPDMVFHFTNADFVLEPQNLFFMVNTAGTVACLAMAANTGLSILGNIQQQDHLIVYDLDEAQIGFQSTSC